MFMSTNMNNNRNRNLKFTVNTCTIQQIVKFNFLENKALKILFYTSNLFFFENK